MNLYHYKASDGWEVICKNPRAYWGSAVKMIIVRIISHGPGSTFVEGDYFSCDKNDLVLLVEPNSLFKEVL